MKLQIGQNSKSDRSISKDRIQDIDPEIQRRSGANIDFSNHPVDPSVEQRAAKSPDRRVRRKP
jgi:hypothetical protein